MRTSFDKATAGRAHHPLTSVFRPAALLLWFAVALAPSAGAMSVTVAFEGVISSVVDDLGDFPGVFPGDVITGTYTYDDSALDVDGNSQLGTYLTNIEYTVAIDRGTPRGPLLFSSTGPHDVSRINTIDGPYFEGFTGTTVDEDRYSVNSTEISSGGFTTNSLIIFLRQTPAGDLMLTDDLTGPLPDPSVANQDNLLSFHTRSALSGGPFPIILNSTVSGTVTSLQFVPEPGAAVLFAVTALVYGTAMRRSRMRVPPARR